MDKEKKELVFVYGSLKRGYGNHGFLVDQNFLGVAKTSESNFYMVSLGAFPATIRHESGKKITGEVYEVDEQTFKSLDQLEGQGSLYSRNKEMFDLQNGKKVEAWIYLMPRQIANSVVARGYGRNSLKAVHIDGDSFVWL